MKYFLLDFVSNVWPATEDKQLTAHIGKADTGSAWWCGHPSPGTEQLLVS